MAQLIVDFERARKLPEFIQLRAEFEGFLIHNRSLLNQVIRKFGTKASGTRHLREFYEDVLDLIRDGNTAGIVDALRGEPRYSYLQPGESPYDGVAPTKYSTQVKSGLVLRELLPTAPKCSICGGLIPAQAFSVDHKHRREEGGLATVDNAQITHPYCQTGYKEMMHAKEKKAAQIS